MSSSIADHYAEDMSNCQPDSHATFAKPAEDHEMVCENSDYFEQSEPQNQPLNNRNRQQENTSMPTSSNQRDFAYDSRRSDFGSTYRRDTQLMNASGENLGQQTTIQNRNEQYNIVRDSLQ